jgi:hypothetical protein
VGRPGVQAITPESAIMMPESAITMPGIADHHAGTSDHDGLEWAITFDWNARSQWAGLRTSRSIEEVIETRGFARKNDEGRNADRRLANHRLQPLGHLTAARKLSIRHASSYGNTALPKIVHEIVPTASPNPPRKWRRACSRSTAPNAAVLFADNHAGN